MQQGLVSILLPFKNTDAYLAECLDSILAQTYTHWELLIVDDHSTDKSYEIVASYANRDQRIKLLKNKGAGIIDALDTAFKHSEGQFITRMDSDDIMHKSKLERMSSQLLLSGPGHLSLGLVEYFSSEGLGGGYLNYQNWLNALTRTGSNYQDLYKECVIPSPCWMVYRQDLIACGAFSNDRYPEDYDLAFRFYEQGLQCLPSQDLLHYWRDYACRTSRNHEHYAQNHFLELKIGYFLKLHHTKSRPLCLWGAGKKGKLIAQHLINQGVEFSWLCDNPKKIGKHIYNQKMRHFDRLESLYQPQCIVMVANPEEQLTIKQYFEKMNMKSLRDYFFFC